MASQEDANRRIEQMKSWVSKRATRSDEPGRYMKEWRDELDAGLTGFDLLSVPMDFTDPVLVAAEIEALCTMRALKWWGTDRGLCLPHGGAYLTAV